MTLYHTYIVHIYIHVHIYIILIVYIYIIQHTLLYESKYHILVYKR